eukprot:1023915-Amorphochlora_amoeboformis.AAC.1
MSRSYDLNKGVWIHDQGPYDELMMMMMHISIGAIWTMIKDMHVQYTLTGYRGLEVSGRHQHMWQNATTCRIRTPATSVLHASMYRGV